MLFRGIVLVSLILVYIGTFSSLDNISQNRDVQLQRALPAKFQRVISGYLSQLVSEILFIRNSVFLGGVKPGTSEDSYAEPLANNFEVMTSLYPEFMDSYYFNQSYLAPISKESASRANAILGTGIKTFPDNLTLRFFQAFNYSSYLNEPLRAAEAFEAAAELPDAPPMFGHLAAVFSAKGGNLTAGLIMLKTILATEENDVVRGRYQREIEAFHKSLAVENAISLYLQKYHVPPENLEQLIPEYLNQLPEIKDVFVLTYDPPVLRLERP